MRFVFSLFILLLYQFGISQNITAIETKWSDDFRDWYIYTDDEEVEGFLELRWPINNDWTEWEFEVGEHWGVAKQKWRDNPNYWEFRVDGKLVTARTRWNNDIREWRVESDNIRLLFKSRWSNILNEWETIKSDYGFFAIYSEWEDDPRTWLIVDEMDEDVPTSIKIALSFLAIFHAIPK